MLTYAYRGLMHIHHHHHDHLHVMTVAWLSSKLPPHTAVLGSSPGSEQTNIYCRLEVCYSTLYRSTAMLYLVCQLDVSSPSVARM